MLVTITPWVTLFRSRVDILFDTPKLQRIMESRELIRRHHGDLARKLFGGALRVIHWAAR
jgi:hypothetical protein